MFNHVLFCNIDTSVPRNPKTLKVSTNVYVLEWKKPLRELGKTVKIMIYLEWRMKHSGDHGKEKREITLSKSLRSRGRRDKSFDWRAEMKKMSPVRRLELKDLFPNSVYSISIQEGMRVKNGIRWSGRMESVRIETPAGSKCW